MSAVHTILTPTVYDGRLIYDKNVEIGEGARVLDAGVGSGEGRYTLHDFIHLELDGCRLLVVGPCTEGTR